MRKRRAYGSRRKARAHPGPDPLYWQAYPSISLPGVERQFRKCELFCEWFSQLQLVGQMDLVSLDGGDLEILYSCGDDTYRHQRTAIFTAVPRLQCSGRDELRAACPGCRTFTDRLIFRGGRWACRRCQGLGERRAFFGGRERLIARREQIVRIACNRDKPLKSHLAEARCRDELRQIDAFLDETGTRFMDPVLRHGAVAVWFSQDGERTERELDDVTPPHIDRPHKPQNATVLAPQVLEH